MRARYLARSACPQGTFQSAEGATDCTTCPLATRSLQSNGSVGCACEIGFYNAAESEALNLDCRRLPPGTVAESSAVSVTVWTIPIAIGFWRPSNRSLDVRPCLDYATGEDSQHSSCRGGRDPSAQCARGTHGPFCQLCELVVQDGKEVSVYFVAGHREADGHFTQSHCKACSSSHVVNVVPLTIVICLWLLAVSCLIAWSAVKRRPAFAQSLQQIEAAIQRLTPVVKLKVAFTFYSIASRINAVYSVRLPWEVERLVQTLNSILSAGLGGNFINFWCVGLDSHLKRLQFWMAFPLVLLGLVLLATLTDSFVSQVCWGHARTFKPPKLTTTTTMRMLKLLYLIYPSVTKVAFDSFSCITFVDDNVSWLAADLSVSCDSPAYDAVTRWGWAAVIIYPVGMIVLNAVLLFLAHAPCTERSRGHHGSRRRTKFVQATTEFLTHDYTQQQWWWELAEMFRRLMLVGLLGLDNAAFPRGSVHQVMFALLFSLLFLCVQMQTAPFRRRSDNFLASSASFSLVVIFACCLAYLFTDILHAPDVAAAMNGSQIHRFSISRLPLTVVFAVAALSTVNFNAIVFVGQVAHERKYLMMEARQRVVRRPLLDAQTGLPVPIPPLESEDCYHIFLSHRQADGQDLVRVIKHRLLDLMPGISVFLDVDDLKTGAGIEPLTNSSTVVILITPNYLASSACMAELLYTYLLKKRFVCLFDSSSNQSALSQSDMNAQLAHALSEFDDGFLQIGAARMPTAEELSAWLLSEAPLFWSRVIAFQDVILKGIVSTLLATELAPEAPSMYVRDEVTRHLAELTEPQVRSKRFHVFCSVHNAGARMLVDEVQRLLMKPPPMELEASLSMVSRWNTFAKKFSTPKMLHPRAAGLLVSENSDDLEDCDHMLLYLNAQTWTSGNQSELLAEDIKNAMAFGVHLLLAHESLDLTTSEARHACAFESFFSNESGATPSDLIESGIYHSIAVPLRGDLYREASIAMVLQAIAFQYKRTLAYAAPRPKPKLAQAFVARLSSRSSSRVSRRSAEERIHSGHFPPSRPSTYDGQTPAITTSSPQLSERSVATTATQLNATDNGGEARARRQRKDSGQSFSQLSCACTDEIVPSFSFTCRRSSGDV